MRPDEPMAEALRAALEEHALKLKKRLRKAARGDADAIHDARTTLRRIREGLVIMGRTAFDPVRTSRLERQLHDVEQTMAPTRDDDVLAADLDGWLKRASRGARRQLAPFHAFLDRRRRRDARRLSRDLTRGGVPKHVRKTRRFLRGHPRGMTPPPHNPAKATPMLVRHFLPDETWRAYEEVLAYETKLPANFDVIHQVRSSCRRLRYAIELFAGALPAGAKELMRALRSLQDRLGELHDHAVAVARIDDWLARGKVKASPALDAYRTNRVAKRDRLRAEFESEWRALTGGPFRVALSHLVSGETPPGSSPSIACTPARRRAGRRTRAGTPPP
jgi:CHAD domain-containing protein